jgi:hypothetical protein
LKDRGVLAQAIVKGAGTRDFFGTAYGEHEGKFDGFKLGDANVQFDDTLLLIDSQAAKQYEAASIARAAAAPATTSPGATVSSPSKQIPSAAPEGTTATVSTQPKARLFYGAAEVNASTAKIRLVQIAEEIVSVLASDPNATLKITLEIDAQFPDGVSDQIKRAVSENADSLGFKAKTWE